MTQTQANYEVTENAINRINELIIQEKKNTKAMRITVEAGGCNGMQYKFDLTDIINNDDVIFEKNGVKVVSDEMSAQFIQNAYLDYVEELGSAYFTIINPNASSKCGCGNSFGI